MTSHEHDEPEPADDETPAEDLALEEQGDDVRGGASQGGTDMTPWTTTHGK